VDDTGRPTTEPPPTAGCGDRVALPDVLHRPWLTPRLVRHRRQPPAARSGRRRDRRLIALLLSGPTDQAIARQLGVGHRMMQRRVAALIDDLDVHTRFQAGVQAAFRGASSDRH
jgi:DNA-binding NarL/FixJ family response regulator